jgi:predicted N-acyltransferase
VSSSPALQLRVLESIRAVPASTWNALTREGGSPFVEYDWLELLEDAGCVGGASGWTPAHLSLWREGHLVAAAPAYAKMNSEGEFVFDWSWADFAERIGVRYYPKLVVAVPFTPASGDRVIAAPGEDRAQLTSILADGARAICERSGISGAHVLFPREDEEALWASRGYLRRDGFQFHWFREGAAKFEDYLARFTSKQRNQIKRELRGVREAGITVETLSGDAHTEDIARAMYSFYASTIEKHGVWGRLYLNERFFLGAVERLRDRLAFVVARDARSGEIVAGAFNVSDGRTLYGRYWGTRVDVPYLHFVVCYYEGIRHCLERGIDVFEPGAGGEHKRPRGFVPTLTRSAHWLADRKLRSALAPWLERESARVRAIVAEAEEPEAEG